MIANPVVNVGMEMQNGVGIIKRTGSLLGAGTVTVGLLFMMTQLINNELPELEERKAIVIPPFVAEPKEDSVTVIKVERPTVDVAPRIDVQFVVDEYTINDDVPQGIGATEFTSLQDVANRIGLPSGMALIPISPRFPDRAAQMGICGQVLVQFDIGGDGVPMNVAILESSHRVFNGNAMKAVQRSRYKPAADGSQAAMVVGRIEKISFKLDGGC